MGGVSVLLMIAAMGITYGWQPDDDGGVEYIIQIPPEQIHEIERIGQITSLIDPTVRGQVSRVVIRVGKGPLPRTSAIFAGKDDVRTDRNVIAASDQSPVPIPEIGDPRRAMPISRLDPTGSTDATPAAVMKPDASETNGSGFSFPALPPTLRDAGANAASLSPRGQAFTQAPQVASPTNRAQPQPPGFTGNDPTGELARTRQGGPTTDPAGSRDSTWLSTNPVSGPSTDPIGSTGTTNNRFGSPPTIPPAPVTTNSTTGRQAATGLAPSDTFGKLPGGLSLPPATNQSSTAFGGPAAFPQTNASRGANAQTTNMSTAGTQGANLQVPNSQSSVYSQYEQTQLDLQRRNASNAGTATPYDPTRRNQMQRGTFGQANSSGQGLNYLRTGTEGFNSIATAPSARDGQTSQIRAAPDARLTRQQIEAGAWSVDIYNRPIDRDGKLIHSTDHVAGVYGSDAARPLGRYTDRTNSPLGRTAANQPPSTAVASATNHQAVQPRGGSYPYRQPAPANSRLVNENVQSAGSDLVRPARPNSGAPLDPPSLSNTRPTTVSAGSTVVRSNNQKHVAAQPLFNGMLLISFVANIYLIFWLKNLRVQFRDLVAAKRISNSPGQTV